MFDPFYELFNGMFDFDNNGQLDAFEVATELCAIDEMLEDDEDESDDWDDEDEENSDDWDKEENEDYDYDDEDTDDDEYEYDGCEEVTYIGESCNEHSISLLNKRFTYYQPI